MILSLLSFSGALKADFSQSVLKGLQGVAIEIRPMNVQSDSFFLSEKEVESHAYGTLKELECECCRTSNWM